jgi:hypothetical protein
MDTTDTELKLRDAATQMILALKDTRNEEVVRSCINSFISHARSTTLVMQVESSKNKFLQEWYEKKMEELKKNPILRFFNEQRVHSIHKGVVKPKQETMPILEFRKNGIPQKDEAILHAWVFDDIDNFIPGSSGNVFRLCEEYYTLLKELVAEWVGVRFTLESIEIHNKKSQKS